MPHPPPPPSAMRRPLPAGAAGAPAGYMREGGGTDSQALLQSNPDFEIPGMKAPGRGGGAGGRGRGMLASGAVPGVRVQRSSDVVDVNGPMSGLTGTGRYPPPP
jgi:hypothetical protein